MRVKPPFLEEAIDKRFWNLSMAFLTVARVNLFSAKTSLQFTGRHTFRTIIELSPELNDQLQQDRSSHFLIQEFGTQGNGQRRLYIWENREN